jgi:probable HAF family extracellular repeat protein
MNTANYSVRRASLPCLLLGWMLIACGGATAFAQSYHLTDLGTLPGRVDSSAAAINNAGQIVGTSYNYIPNYPNYPFGILDKRAFLYSGGSMTDLGTLDSDHPDSVASAINNSGQVVGYSLNGFGFARSFEYSGGSLSEIGIYSANGINSKGQIVGSAGDGFGAIYDHGNITGLQTAVDGSLPGYYSDASAINSQGQVAGYV